ncbi:MAG: type IV pili methyl-accepting chemotaxis transducer N-terminal domain-containing protein [Neisseria sp.]|nr:type IV pili methyl-accepting chemotaxis transducer N-terminal domain-containing protein [Neisseria sp.]
MPLKSLSSRLKSLTLLWVAVAAGSIILTLLFSWRLEGGGAAINDAGSLRMQTYRLALQIQQQAPTAEIEQKIQHFDETLLTLQQGDPTRPLFLPDTAPIREHMALLQSQWNGTIKPMFQAAVTSPQAPDNARLYDFVGNIDDLVRAVEAVNTRYTKLLRLFQSALMAMVLISAVIMIMLLYIWVIKPLEILQRGMSAIHDGQLGVQVPLDSSSEFAQVDEGFNRMSLRLQRLYTHLEQEVANKTRDLADKNYSLETLYFFARFLNRAQSEPEAAEMFLQKIMAIVPAQAGSIRLIDLQRRRMDLMAHVGLPESLQNADACRRLDDCLCGQSVRNDNWQPILFAENAAEHHVEHDALPVTTCEKFGFRLLHLVKIRYGGQDLGVMALYFDEDYTIKASISKLLKTLCNQFGVVITNIRLADESRHLAVLQERNLLAQGLHDSIAQSLTFLNLQVQMLESALQAQETEQAAENLQFIKEGVQECYDDVRELLLNFRTKISSKEFGEAVQTLVERFEQQTRMKVNIIRRGDGPPLNTEQQLQFIFILQESLSNIRKHAQASNVSIELDNRQDFVMRITDNGQGFDLAHFKQLPGKHVGVRIMQERAHRIRAHLQLNSQPGQYASVCLTLPHQERALA